MAYKRTGRPPGRPTKEEAAERRRLASERLREANTHGRLPKLGPPVPRGLGWGGPRPGAGRPKGERRVEGEMAYFRLDGEMATKLAELPEGTRSEYIRRAIELMIQLSPPGQYQAPAGETESETPSETPSGGITGASSGDAIR